MFARASSPSRCAASAARSRPLPRPARVTALLFAATLAACSSIDPGPGSAAFQAGALGNGGFTFSCADTKDACLAQTNADARAFPAGVVKGSTFRVRYIPKPGVSSSVNAAIDDNSAAASASTSGTGTGSISSVGEKYLQPASPAGFLAVTAGTGTLMARDNTGALIEFTTLAIREAARLSIFEATFEGASSAPSVRSIVMKKGEQRSFRVVAQDATDQILGGSFLTEWKAEDAKIADVDSRDRGVVKLAGLAVGKTNITVAGLANSTAIAVEVQP
jgi:hypothetical protein